MHSWVKALTEDRFLLDFERETLLPTDSAAKEYYASHETMEFISTQA
jgi:hypothetical protein